MGDSLKLHGWDLVIIAAYMVICLVIGFYRSLRIKTPQQFALGYQNISTPILVCIIFASTTGGGTLLGYAEKITLFGLSFAIAKLFAPIGWLITARIYSPNIEQFRGCSSISEIMYKLYGPLGRWITTIAAIIMGIGILVAQALAIGYVFNYFFGMKIIYGILISYGILAAYTALGGIRAVIITEIFQFSIFFFIIPISYIITIMDIGGIPSLASEMQNSTWGFDFTAENIMLLASFIFFTIVPECNAPFIQRCLIATSAGQLQKALKTVGLMSLPLMLSIFLIAYIVKIHSPEVPDSEAFVFYISNYLPVGIKGLMVAGTIAIIMGLAEAWLNTISVIIVNDIAKVVFPDLSASRQLTGLRISIIILAIIAVIFASFSNNIIQVIWLVENLWTPLILIPFVSGFLGFRTSSLSFIASIVMALIFSLVSKVIIGEFTIISLSLGIIGSAIGLFGMHYWQAVKRPILKENTNWLHLLTSKAKRIFLTVHQFLTASLKRIINIATPKEAPYQRFTIFTLAYYFAYTFSLTSDPTHRIFAYLLVVGYSLCFILLFRELIFNKRLQKKYLTLYWYCTLTFCLPSVASYMLFASQGNDFWIINGLLSAFSLYFFVDAITFIVLLSLGILSGYGFFLLNEPGHQHILTTHNTLEHIGYIYIFFLLAYLMLFRGREKEHSDKIGQMHMLSGAIAHELKTPISSMVMFTQFINEILSKTMNSAKQTGDEYIITMNKNEYNFLKEANQSVQQVGAQGISTVNNILNSLKSSVIGDEKSLYSITDCVNKAIKDYSHTNKKAKEIKVNIVRDFNILCSFDYLTQVLFNLLKNAYKHGGADVKIEIWTQGSKLYFKDNGKGIPKKDLPYIFDRFYTKSKTGIGIGLAFCKMVIEDLGGHIECISELGEHTTFILSFPESIA